MADSFIFSTLTVSVPSRPSTDEEKDNLTQLIAHAIDLHPPLLNPDNNNVHVVCDPANATHVTLTIESGNEALDAMIKAAKRLGSVVGADLVSLNLGGDIIHRNPPDTTASKHPPSDAALQKAARAVAALVR